jgi:hypothetical protein
MVVNSPFLTGQLLLKQWLRPPTPIKSMENHYNLKKRKNEKWARPDWLAFSVSSGLCHFAEFIHVNSLVAFVACAFSV